MPRTLPVQSKNQWFQRVEALLRNRNKRHREGRFVVEGVRSINQLVAHAAWEIDAFLYATDRSLSDWARATLAGSRADVHLELSAPLMAELSDKDEPSELLAVARIPADDPARLGRTAGADERPAVEQPSLYVLLDRPALPGNLGTLIRSCDALGADGTVVFGHAADLYDPQTVRATAGSLFAHPVVRMAARDALCAWIEDVRARAPGLRLVATTAHAGDWPDAVDLAAPTVLMLGNETAGLSHHLLELCDATVRIPMRGAASSLNVACAATALLYEAARQRRPRSPD
jgi:23S rRNA (uridine2479-2'-O)-methyltransferase